MKNILLLIFFVHCFSLSVLANDGRVCSKEEFLQDTSLVYGFVAGAALVTSAKAGLKGPNKLVSIDSACDVATLLATISMARSAIEELSKKPQVDSNTHLSLREKRMDLAHCFLTGVTLGSAFQVCFKPVVGLGCVPITKDDIIAGSLVGINSALLLLLVTYAR